MSTTPETTFSTRARPGAEGRPFAQPADGFLGEPWVGDRRRGHDRIMRLTVAVIDDRPLIQDCFGRGLMAIDDAIELKYFPDLNAFDNADPDDVAQVNILLICATWSKAKANLYLSQIAAIRQARPDLDAIILSDVEDISDIIGAFERGVRGYIPPTVSLEVAVSAMRLVAAGGVYIPTNVLTWYDRIRKQGPNGTPPDEGANIFTSRQKLVIEALRKGKANKIIAYDLNMCESTVKVHVRNIMKRLKARNRTEVAYLLSKMEGADHASERFSG